MLKNLLANFLLKKIATACALFAAGTLCGSAENAAGDVPAPNAASKSVVVFVTNESGAELQASAEKALERHISSRIANLGFAPIGRDFALKSLDAFSGATEENQTHKSLTSKSTLLRLSETLGADFVLSVSVGAFGKTARKFGGYGVETENVAWTLRAPYTLYDAASGAGVAGGNAVARKVLRSGGNVEIETDEVLDDLLADVAEQIAEKLGAQNKAEKIAKNAAGKSEIFLICSIEAMSFPVVKEEKGKYFLGTETVPATLGMVNAEIDGVHQTIAVSSETPLELGRGIHTLRIVQEGIVPVEKTINVTGKPRQTIAIQLSLTEEMRERWKGDMEFVEKMIARAKSAKCAEELAAAEAERIRGIAAMFRQSGSRIDIRRNEKSSDEKSAETEK